MREIDISGLLGIWFHDVRVNRIEVDYLAGKVEFDCVIPVGFWNSSNRDGLTEGEKTGTLVFTGLLYFVMQPPGEGGYQEENQGIEITSESSVTQENCKVLKFEMPEDLPDDAFLHFFYISAWNSTIIVGATEVNFQDT